LKIDIHVSRRNRHDYGVLFFDTQCAMRGFHYYYGQKQTKSSFEWVENAESQSSHRRRVFTLQKRVTSLLVHGVILSEKLTATDDVSYILVGVLQQSALCLPKSTLCTF